MTIAEIDKVLMEEHGRPWELRFWARRLDPETLEMVENEWGDEETAEIYRALGRTEDEITGIAAYERVCENIIVTHWVNQYSRDEMVALLNGFTKEPELMRHIKITIHSAIEPMSLEDIACKWRETHGEEKPIEIRWPNTLHI